VDIQELKRRHYNIKQSIDEAIIKGKYPEQKLAEYHEVVNALEKAGVRINDRGQYVLKALEMEKNKSKPKPKQQTTVSSSDSIFRITIAWTAQATHEPDNTIQILENYLIQNKAKPTEKEDNDFGDHVEHMRVYEWFGDDREFTILRRSANYILDTFAENSYEKFNISIFGNKKK